MCKIKFSETFRMNVSVLDFSEKSYSRKNVLFEKFKNLDLIKKRRDNSEK